MIFVGVLFMMMIIITTSSGRIENLSPIERKFFSQREKEEDKMVRVGF